MYIVTTKIESLYRELSPMFKNIGKFQRSPSGMIPTFNSLLLNTMTSLDEGYFTTTKSRKKDIIATAVGNITTMKRILHIMNDDGMIGDEQYFNIDKRLSDAKKDILSIIQRI